MAMKSFFADLSQKAAAAADTAKDALSDAGRIASEKADIAKQSLELSRMKSEQKELFWEMGRALFVEKTTGESAALKLEELLAQAVDRFTDVVIADAITLAKISHADTVFVPLHAGVDEFMSPSDYENYYWPSLKKLLCALIAADLTPFVFCEGNYHTRLNCLKDVPKGKIAYFFEKQDMARAKRELEGIACVGGNMSTATLMHGTTEQVVTETRRLLDTCAPGGGYIMSNDISLDNCKRENLVAWYEAMEKYGRY